MFCCAYDPGLALFLAETSTGKETSPGPLDWTALAFTLGLAVLALAVPA